MTSPGLLILALVVAIAVILFCIISSGKFFIRSLDAPSVMHVYAPLSTFLVYRLFTSGFIFVIVMKGVSVKQWMRN